MNTRRQGTAYERVAEEFLIRQGAKILARNVRGAGGEIDLIAQMDGATVFVEVKQRSTDQKGTPGEAVDRAKQRRICRAALVYIKQHGLMDARLRFDVVEILDDRIRHVKSAFAYQG